MKILGGAQKKSLYLAYSYLEGKKKEKRKGKKKTAIRKEFQVF